MSPSVDNSQVADLYQSHHSWLYNWLRRRMGCSHAAADLAQDTFVRILARRNLASSPMQSLQEPRAYLWSIAKGLVIDHLRRRSLEQAYLEALAHLPEACGISPEEQEILLQTLHRIDALLDQLPESVRQAFLLSQIQGLTYAEIAQQMNLSPRTIKRYMQQGFAQCITAMF
ncbi:RNA polymerase subunit sigma [Cellvibrio mixtus]|uniref:RNA polymerase subunit sigma n=1 Tax=Cellvibrio mixtus TaxID=39650 RepID=A0A266Q704_9GAMM|nr:sigma-70 family RNA polymerase sigma factor [Cellvibrio mixtus]OZY85610.1 RNA polymerase subunit sigma [Cellvibrio mixtus]